MGTWKSLFGRRFDPTAQLVCPDVIDWVDAYVDQALPAVATTEISRHVAGCEGCRTIVSERTLIKRRVKTSVHSVNVLARLSWKLQAALRE